MTQMTLKRKRTYGPDVSLMRFGDRYVVEKTYRKRAWPVRMIGILLVSWEAFIYAKLKGISGIPKLRLRPDEYTLVTSYMGGENLRTTTKKPDGLYFDKLSELIEQVHQRGVVHLDLRNSRNYGIDTNGLPYLVDFASSLYIPWPEKLRDILGSIDWMGVLKIKENLNPELISSEDQRRLALGKTLSNLWLPGKAMKSIYGMIRYLRTSLFGSA